ncbi:MAG: hypothetical protein HYU56_02730 [Candidatus Aenigmarchaeota archaeon]|nr:hypothetical protein [Candidatus Aenigmarchaeota archaeon]
MIDYKHPIIVEMKGKYTKSREAYNLADDHQRIGLGDARQLFEDAHTKLAGAETAVYGLRDKMKAASGLSPDEREHHLYFMDRYLGRIRVLLRKTRKHLDGTKV